MPLLQSIAQQLDGELVRLQTLRELVAELGRTPLVVVQIHSRPTLAATPQEPVMAAVLHLLQPGKPTRELRADAGRPRGRQTSKAKRVSQPPAFAVAIPSGPVVFNPSQLAQERAKREQGGELQVPAEPVQAAEDLDALSRSLAARWNTAMVQ